MTTKTKLTIIGIIFIFVYIAINQENTLTHEKIHKEIFDYYEIDSKIIINNPIEAVITGRTGYTQVLNNTQYYNNCDSECKKLNIENEMIGYNMTSLYSTIMMIGLILTILITLFISSNTSCGRGESHIKLN